MQWFEQGLTTLAWLWRVERADGVAVGFTSHDRDLWRPSTSSGQAGFLYRAAPGMVPSAIERREGVEPDDLDVAGALTSEVFAEADLRAGRWDGATVTVSACDWADPEAMPVVLAKGILGAVEISDGGFSAALRGSAALFERAATEATSPSCRAELGDVRCRVDLAGRRVRAVATAAEAEGAAVSVTRASTGSALTAPYFSGGQLWWLDGANAGLSARIVADDGAVLTLEDAPAFAVAPGDRAELTEGCDKAFATCCAWFGNAANFRGEPHLPGNDLLVRYGG
jgi:uncharacterized phage protein (TIGR02218 family)